MHQGFWCLKGAVSSHACILRLQMNTGGWFVSVVLNTESHTSEDCKETLQHLCWAQRICIVASIVEASSLPHCHCCSGWCRQSTTRLQAGGRCGSCGGVEGGDSFRVEGFVLPLELPMYRRLALQACIGTCATDHVIPQDALSGRSAWDVSCAAFELKFSARDGGL